MAKAPIGKNSIVPRSIREIGELLNQSRAHSQNVWSENGYNTNHLLTQEQIKLGIIYKASCNSGKPMHIIFEETHIDGLTIGDDDVANFFSDAEGHLSAYNINQAINNAAYEKKPAFFAIENGNHFALTAVLPGSNLGEVSVQYFNSIPGNPTGQGFAQGMYDHIRTLDAITLNGRGFINKSIDQQHNQCCGLSVAYNAVDLLLNPAHWHHEDQTTDWRFAPQTVVEKINHYNDFGQRLFSLIDLGKKSYLDNHMQVDSPINNKAMHNNDFDLSKAMGAEMMNAAAKAAANNGLPPFLTEYMNTMAAQAMASLADYIPRKTHKTPPAFKPSMPNGQSFMSSPSSNMSSNVTQFASSSSMPYNPEFSNASMGKKPISKPDKINMSEEKELED